MSKNIQLRLEYVKLIQEGKNKEARNILSKIWELKNPNLDKEPKDNKKEIKEPVKDLNKKNKPNKCNKCNDIDSLKKVKGIGKETLKDIKLIYSNIEDLYSDLKGGKDLPLRNDIEKKLKKHFGI